MPDEKTAVAPGITELFEQSLLALARAPSVFAAAAQRPAPSFAAAAGLALASGAAALAVNLTHGLVANPDLLQRFPPPMIGAVAVAAVGLYACLFLLLAVLLYGLARALGGTGDFDRALQAAAALSLMAPLQSLCNWFPIAWMLPVLLAAWVAAGALEGLFKTKPLPARAACAVLAGLALGLQFAGRVFVERAAQSYALTQAAGMAVKSNGDLARQIQAIQQQAGATTAAPGISSLDLLRGPAGEAVAPATAEDTQAAPTAGADEVQQHASAMLGALTPMLDTAAAGKNLSPRQKADMQNLQALMKDLQAQLQPGAPRLSSTEQAKRMAMIQQMTMRMMSAGMKPAPASQNEVPK